MYAPNVTRTPKRAFGSASAPFVSQTSMETWSRITLLPRLSSTVLVLLSGAAPSVELPVVVASVPRNMTLHPVTVCTPSPLATTRLALATNVALAMATIAVQP